MNRWGLYFDRLYTKHLGRYTGQPVMERDWDNLLILDAARYDTFREHNCIDGNLQSHYSMGSSTDEFVLRNFHGERHHDTVYVTANPWVNNLDTGTFHAVINLLEGETWNSKLETVLPGTVVDQAAEANETYPNKRLIVHFIQPHFPAIGQRGRRLRARGDDEGHSVWTQLRYGLGDLEVEDVWEAYNENHEVLMPHVQELIAGLDGKSVVTSDHGNLFGERISPIPVRGYGHPSLIRTDELVKVPWHVIDSDTRRTVRSDPPSTTDTLDPGVVEERLSSLGYT